LARPRDTADLFVIGNQDFQRCLQGLAAGVIGNRQHFGQKALHICRAASKKPIPIARQLKGRPGPYLSVDRHNVGVCRQQNTAVCLRTYFCVKAGFCLRQVGDTMHPKLASAQKILDKGNQIKVGPIADSVKCDQPFQDLQ